MDLSNLAEVLQDKGKQALLRTRVSRRYWCVADTRGDVVDVEESEFRIYLRTTALVSIFRIFLPY